MKYKYSKRKQAKAANYSLSAVIVCIIAAAMTIGVIAGTVTANFLTDSTFISIKNYLSGFIGGFDKTSLNLPHTFISSFYKYIKIVLAVWLSGFFTAGTVFIIGMLFVKSFAYGFTTAVLVKYLGFYGLVVCFNSYIPQNLFFLPALCFVAYNSLLLSGKKLYYSNPAQGKGYVEYILVLLIGIICSTIAALIETLLTPVLLEYIIQ